MNLEKIGRSYVLTIDDEGDVVAIDTVGIDAARLRLANALSELGAQAQLIVQQRRTRAYAQATPAVKAQVDALLAPFTQTATAARTRT
jgi:hypothetical protein